MYIIYILLLYMYTNMLLLKMLKWLKILFYWSHSQMKFDYEYYILGDKLKQVNNVRDLGVTFQQNLMFSFHVEQICSKALKKSWFSNYKYKIVWWWCLPKTLYYISNVGPILEYCSVL